jgi:hypothetical protein
MLSEGILGETNPIDYESKNTKKTSSLPQPVRGRPAKVVGIISLGIQLLFSYVFWWSNHDIFMVPIFVMLWFTGIILEIVGLIVVVRGLYQRPTNPDRMADALVILTVSLLVAVGNVIWFFNVSSGGAGLH